MCVDLGCELTASHNPLSTQIHRAWQYQTFSNFARYRCKIVHWYFAQTSVSQSQVIEVIISSDGMWKALCSSVRQLCCPTPICGLLLLFSLSLFLSLSPSLSLPVAGSNKGLTGRAWRSWLLDGKGESHSWAGQASSLAKVMSCVRWDRRGGGRAFIWHTVYFFFLFPYGHLVWWGKSPGVFW